MENPIDLSKYFPFYFGTIANRWTSASSKAYLKEFGIGVGEWRILATTFALKKTTANEIATLIIMDPGLVSRSIKRLEKNGFVQTVSGQHDGRIKLLELTENGNKLHKKILKNALDREERLLRDLSSPEREHLLILLRKIMNNVNDL